MNFTIVTAVTPEYLKKLRWTLPTWPQKPQFRDKPIVIFTNGIKKNNEYKDLAFVKEYYKDWTFVDWNMKNIDSMRELMLSAFVLGHKYIKTSHYVKLDCDTFFMNDKDVFDDRDFEYDIVGHKWGYTKPAAFISKLNNFYYKKNDPISKDRRINHARLASFCCLQKTEFVKDVADKCGSRLPIPSHDTLLWWMANEMKDRTWGSKNIKRLGVGTNTRWKSIREMVCVGDCHNNKMLNRELMSHVQLELTTNCNLKCFNCDRNCGVAPSKEYMALEQVWKFVEESIERKHRWKRIDIIGGEPTMYQDLETVWKFIKLYKDKYPRCKIRFSTNGVGKKVQDALKLIPKWVEIRNSSKKSQSNNFVAYNSAPIDRGEKEIRCCSVPWRCGIALTRYGYFLCGAGASVARVFGLNIGIDTLRDVNPESILKQIQELCKYCGHSIVKSRFMTNEQVTSESWQKAIKLYQEHEMDLY